MKKRGTKTGSYHRKKKAEVADRYGQFRDGRRLSADVIAGRRVGTGGTHDAA